MKKDLAILGIILLSVLYSAAKENKGIKALVVRNCASTYLRIEGKNIEVCNQEALKNYMGGEEIVVIYSSVKNYHAGKKEDLCQTRFQGAVKIQNVR